MPRQIKTSFGFGAGFTRTGKYMLLAYAVIYVLELILEHWLQVPIVESLRLYPLGHPDFSILQLPTHLFLHAPDAPIAFLINCLVFYFFAAPIENALGTARFLKLFYIAAAGAALCGLLFSAVSAFSAPFMGMLPSLLALVTVFGLLNPEATILLMFILPVKAKYLSYGTIVITLLTFLAKANPHGAYHLGGILFGLLYFKGPKQLFSLNRLQLMYFQWQLKRKRSRFTVINGDKKDDDPPTYH